MSGDKSSISQARSYRELGNFWDTHDLGDYWDQTEPVEFEVNIESEEQYYALDSEMSARLAYIARRRGVSAETLLNIWVQEKLQEEQRPLAA